MIERTWLICGADLLGMPPMTHPIGPCNANPFMPAIPATPVMDSQLDELAIGSVLLPLGSDLLRLFKAKVLARKKEDQYEIFLAAFLILSNAERVLHDMVDFTEACGLQVRYVAHLDRCAH